MEPLVIKPAFASSRYDQAQLLPLPSRMRTSKFGSLMLRPIVDYLSFKSRSKQHRPPSKRAQVQTIDVIGGSKTLSQKRGKPLPKIRRTANQLSETKQQESFRRRRLIIQRGSTQPKAGELALLPWQNGSPSIDH